ncbi:FAD-dependent oxidoreductase, partial [Escherichia coli]|uniref:FAD-dependent oxidoreductase n=1 Tax=Escherichia coli TaxID=562 RepID=UPI001FCE3711
MNKYQAVIIGFGKAGKTLAVTLAKAGWRVALIEQSNAMYGGTCINIGCIPTKTLVHDAQQHTDFVLMNPLMILVKIIKLRWIHILSYDQM